MFLRRCQLDCKNELRAQTYKDEHHSCGLWCGFCGPRVTLPCGTKGEWSARFKLVRKNVPSLFSLVSLLLNILILSLLLPNLHNKVTFMEGQTASLQSSVDSLMDRVSREINEVDVRVKTFNGLMDEAERKFNVTGQHIDITLAGADATLALIQNGTAWAAAELWQAQLNLAQLINTFMTAITAASASTLTTAADFQQRVIPAFEQDMRGLNLTSQLHRLSAAKARCYLHGLESPVVAAVPVQFDNISCLSTDGNNAVPTSVTFSSSTTVVLYGAEAGDDDAGMTRIFEMTAQLRVRCAGITFDFGWCEGDEQAYLNNVMGTFVSSSSPGWSPVGTIVTLVAVPPAASRSFTMKALSPTTGQTCSYEQGFCEWTIIQL